MKTTIEIADDLLAQAKRLGRQQRRTLRDITEEGLRAVLAKQSARRSFRCRPVVFSGKGLAPEFAGRGWEAVREAIYDEPAP